MPSHLILAIILAMTVFQPDETLRRYGAAGHEWHLETLHGAPFPAKATLTFPRRGVVEVQGPCNSFQSTNTTPYPWISFGPIAATRRACPRSCGRAPSTIRRTHSAPARVLPAPRPPRITQVFHSPLGGS